jgi:Mor family transcriptional regulator
MNLLNYSRDQIKKLMEDGLCKPTALRDYDVLKDIDCGKKINAIADEKDLSDRQVYRILHAYKRK